MNLAQIINKNKIMSMFNINKQTTSNNQNNNLNIFLNYFYSSRYKNILFGLTIIIIIIIVLLIYSSIIQNLWLLLFYGFSFLILLKYFKPSLKALLYSPSKPTKVKSTSGGIVLDAFREGDEDYKSAKEIANLNQRPNIREGNNRMNNEGYNKIGHQAKDLRKIEEVILPSDHIVILKGNKKTTYSDYKNLPTGQDTQTVPIVKVNLGILPALDKVVPKEYLIPQETIQQLPDKKIEVTDQPIPLVLPKPKPAISSTPIATTQQVSTDIISSSSQTSQVHHQQASLPQGLNNANGMLTYWENLWKSEDELTRFCANTVAKYNQETIVDLADRMEYIEVVKQSWSKCSSKIGVIEKFAKRIIDAFTRVQQANDIEQYNLMLEFICQKYLNEIVSLYKKGKNKIYCNAVLTHLINRSVPGLIDLILAKTTKKLKILIPKITEGINPNLDYNTYLKSLGMDIDNNETFQKFIDRINANSFGFFILLLIDLDEEFADFDNDDNAKDIPGFEEWWIQPYKKYDWLYWKYIIDLIKLPPTIITPAVITAFLDASPLQKRKYPEKIKSFAEILRTRYYPKMINFHEYNPSLPDIKTYKDEILLECRVKMDNVGSIEHPMKRKQQQLVLDFFMFSLLYNTSVLSLTVPN